MADSAFLDKGIILGYCFLADTHHEKCKKYIASDGTEYFTTKAIEDIFRKKKEELINNHRNGILRNIRNVKANYEGELTGSDIKEIQDSIDKNENHAWRYLLDFYNNRSGEEVYEVTEELRRILRQIEKNAEERKEVLYSNLNGWVRFSSYDDIQEVLRPLKRKDEEDFWVCIDAHDVAVNIDGGTELATNNPSDFADEEIRSLILEETALDDIVYVFVSQDYTP